MTLNEQIAAVIEAHPKTPIVDTLHLIKQLSEHDQACWLQYLLPLEHFPAGGLHLSMQEWVAGRVICHPSNVAKLLDAEEEDEPELIQ